MVGLGQLLWALRERGHNERVFVKDGALGLHTKDGDARFSGTPEHGFYWLLEDKPYRMARPA